MAHNQKEASLAKEIHEATEVLKEVEQQSENIVKSQSLLHRFAGGLFSALGAVVLAVIVIPIVVTFLQRVQWIPVIGDFISRVVKQVEHSQPRSSAPTADGQ